MASGSLHHRRGGFFLLLGEGGVVVAASLAADAESLAADAASSCPVSPPLNKSHSTVEVCLPKTFSPLWRSNEADDGITTKKNRA